MVSGRPARLEEMTRDQLVEEKLAMQKGLLYFENMFGRPNGKEDRDTVRPLYDRYRSLKRLLATNAPVRCHCLFKFMWYPYINYNISQYVTYNVKVFLPSSSVSS